MLKYFLHFYWYFTSLAHLFLFGGYSNFHTLSQSLLVVSFTNSLLLLNLAIVWKSFLGKRERERESPAGGRQGPLLATLVSLAGSSIWGPGDESLQCQGSPDGTQGSPGSCDAEVVSQWMVSALLDLLASYSWLFAPIHQCLWSCCFTVPGHRYVRSTGRDPSPRMNH